MRKLELGNWLPGKVKPVHIGVYEIMPLFAWQTFYAKWTGEYWLAAAQSVHQANESRMIAHTQDRDWRGLANKP